MTRAYYASILVSSTLFLFYGIACLSVEGMKRDFERFGLSRFRTLTGTLEVLGALGLIVGQLWPPLVPLSAGGLALMMFVGVATRIRATRLARTDTSGPGADGRQPVHRVVRADLAVIDLSVGRAKARHDP